MVRLTKKTRIEIINDNKRIRREVQERIRKYHVLSVWWLNSRGGRTLNDCFTDSKGKYVLMLDKNGFDTPVYIPEYSVLEILKKENDEELEKRLITRKKSYIKCHKKVV